MLAVRSNWRPAVTEKSAVSTTLAHGPLQPGGGAKLNSFGEKSANATSANSGTTQGVVAGTAIGGSATAVFGEPTVGAPAAMPEIRTALPATASATRRRFSTSTSVVAGTVVRAPRTGQRQSRRSSLMEGLDRRALLHASRRCCTDKVVAARIVRRG